MAEDSKRSAKSRQGEPVWTYRGYELGPDNFTSAMVHLFRAEIQRANVWRERLDSTTNWAIVTTAAAVSFAFSEPLGSHLVILLSTVVVTLLLYIESRRYRYYELWSSRVRLMETDFFATMLVPPFHPSADWGEALADNLLHPQFNVSHLEAIGRRLRRNYIWIFLVLLLAWLAKLWIHPAPTRELAEYLTRASLGSVPGWAMMTGVLFYALALLLLGVLTARLQAATGEVLPRFGESDTSVGVDRSKDHIDQRPWFRSSRRRRQFMSMIITDQYRDIADVIMAEMARGVTALDGTGMYSGDEFKVLVCAITTTEVPQLKSLVRKIDPAAFVVIMPAREVLGRGFIPLE